jgi:hypothetical protein
MPMLYPSLLCDPWYLCASNCPVQGDWREETVAWSGCHLCSYSLPIGSLILLSALEAYSINYPHFSFVLFTTSFYEVFLLDLQMQLTCVALAWKQKSFS